MTKITDYSFLFQNMPAMPKKNIIGSFQLSQLNSRSVQAQLKAAGINTNSRQYKAAVKEMMRATEQLKEENARKKSYTHSCNAKSIKIGGRGFNTLQNVIDPCFCV